MFQDGRGNYNWNSTNYYNALIALVNAADSKSGGSSTWSVDISGCVFPSITAGDALDLSSVTGVVVKKDGTTQSSGFAGHWKLCDGSNLPSNTNAQTYSVKYVLTSGGTAESDCRDIEVSAGGSSESIYYLVASMQVSGVEDLGNGKYGSLLTYDLNTGSYSTQITDHAKNVNWHVEDGHGNVLPLTAEFQFYIWGNQNEPYNNTPVSTNTFRPLSHDNWGNNMNDSHYTFYLYQKNGEWYASENNPGCQGVPHHVRSEANVNGNKRQLHVVNSNCYSVNETSNLHNGDWHLEDCMGNTLPMIAEFNFTTQHNQPYNNTPVSGYIYNELFADCWNYIDQNIHDHCTLYIYKRNGVWYASEDESKCQAAGGSTLSITPNTAQKVACDDITFLASESSNSLEWYYGSTKLSDGNGITINGNSLTISPSFVYANGSANVYAKNGDAESNKVSVGRSEIRLRTNNNENVTLTRYTNARCLGMCAYMFNFNQINNFWTQWWFEQDGVKMSLSIAPGSHSDFKIENGNFNGIDRNKFTTGYVYYDNGWVFSNEDPCRCMTLSVDNAASACGNTIITLNNTCGEITSWTWQSSNDGNNNWNNVTNGGLTYDASGVNNTVYFRVISGNEKSNVVKVSKSGVEIAQNGNAYNYSSLTKLSGCSTCAFVVPLNGSINSMQIDDWYFRTSSGAKIDVIVDSDASFVTKNGNGNFNRVDNNSTSARLYGNLYLYEDSGTWHLTTTNPCPCITVNTSGNISCENATFVITNGCGHNDVRSYKLERWDGNNWTSISEGTNNSISVTSNNINGARYVRAGYAYGNNWTWVYSEPIVVSYLPFDFNSVYDVPQLAGSATGAKLEVSQINPLCCNNYEITVRNTGTEGEWNGSAYLHVAGYKMIIAGDGNNNIAVNKVGNEDVLAVNNNLANQKFYIYVDDTNKKIYVSSHNDERVIGFDVENSDNFPCDDLTLKLVTEPCSTTKYQWYANVDGNIHDIPDATSKTLTVTKEMYEEYGYTNIYGIKIGDDTWTQNNSNYRQRNVNFGLLIPTPSITGSNGVTIDRVVTLCCDDNGGKLHRVDYSGAGQIQFETGESHFKLNDSESGYSITSNGVNVDNTNTTLYVYVKNNNAYWSLKKPEEYVSVALTESVCEICADNRSINVSIELVGFSGAENEFKSVFGLDAPTFIWEGSNDCSSWTPIDGVSGPTLSGETVDAYKHFRVYLSVGCTELTVHTSINCLSYPSVSISGTLRKCQNGTLSSTLTNISNIHCDYSLELQESEDEEVWSIVSPLDYTVSGKNITIDNVSSTYYRYVLKVNGNEFPSNSVEAQELTGFDLKVSYDKSKVYGVNHINNVVDFFVTPSTVAGYWEKLENGAWVDARTLTNTSDYEISGAGTTTLKYKIKNDNHKAIFRFFATEKCTRSESIELKINEIDPICASEGSIIISFNGMNAGRFVANESDDDPYMFIHPEDSRCYVDFPTGTHNSHHYPTGDPNPERAQTFLGIVECTRIGKPTFPMPHENVFGKKNAYYIANRNAMVEYGGDDAVLPPSYMGNDMYYMWWHGGDTYTSYENVTLPKIYPMLEIQYPGTITPGSTGTISIRFWLITDGLDGTNPCHFGFFSDRHGSTTSNMLTPSLEDNPFYNQSCTVTCEATGETWQMGVNNSMMATPINNDCLTEVKIPDAKPGWYTMTAEFKMAGMITENNCPVFYPMVLPYSEKVGVAVEYLTTSMSQTGGSTSPTQLTPSICISAETACTNDAISLFVKGLDGLDTLSNIGNVTIRWFDEANPNDTLVKQSITDIAGNGVSRFDTHFPDGVSYVNYRCEVEIEQKNGAKTTYKNNVQVGRDAECYDCVYIGEDLENVVYTKDVDVRILSTNANLPVGVEYVWQWSDQRYNSEDKWIDIPSESYTLVDGGIGIKLNLKKEDFDLHPYIRVAIKENGSTYCSSNAILLTPMETKCSWEIRGVDMINPQEYEVKYAAIYRVLFHVENNDNWIDRSPRFTMKDIQSETTTTIVCSDKDADGNWYYDVEALSDYEFTITDFCTTSDFVTVRNIKECQSSDGIDTRVWYDDFGRFTDHDPNKTYKTIILNGESYSFRDPSVYNPDFGFRRYTRQVEVNGSMATSSPLYYSMETDDLAFAEDKTGALSNGIVDYAPTKRYDEGWWGNNNSYVNYHVKDYTYAIVYNSAMGSCMNWAMLTEDHTPASLDGDD